jgi:hypothetical protein
LVAIVISAVAVSARGGERAQRPDPTRYTGEWTDGTRLSGETVGPWHDAKSSPKLAGRELFAAGRPIRWLVDNAAAPAPPPDAVVEMVGGDCLPGRVVGFDDGAGAADRRLAPHVAVAPSLGVDWPDGPSRPSVRVVLPWLRRIVWQRAADPYRPRMLFLTDGRQLSYRSVRFSASAVQVLREEGIREFALGEVAELHFPPVDPWDAYFEQLAALGLAPGTRLVRWETTTGLRVTGTTERFQARSHGPAEKPENWYHLIQPAWSLDPLWVRHETIRVRAYFSPHEVPLTRIEPSASRARSDLGGFWPWQAERNVQGGVLESGGVVWPWGFGVHAASRLEFPLPASARWFRTSLGLDYLDRGGGCVKTSIHLGADGTKPVYASNWLVGSRNVVETGPIALGESASNSSPGRLILQVDPAHEGRPAGADPLDIRDCLDWLEPLVGLDPEELQPEVLRRGPGRIPAWQGWKATMGDAAAVRLLSLWDETDPRDPGYRLLVAAGQEPLRLSGKLLVRPYKDQLLLAVNRPPQATPSKLEVRVDGLPLARFDIPVRSSDRSAVLAVPLGAYHHREVTVDLIQQSQDDQALVEWRAITLANRTAVP